MASSTTTLPRSVYLPNPFLGLRHPFFLLLKSQRSPRAVSFARGSLSTKNAAFRELRSIGIIAQDFDEAEAVFDKHLFKVKQSEYIRKKYLILFFYPLEFSFPYPTDITAFNNSYVFSKRILPSAVMSSKTAMSLTSTKIQKEEIRLLSMNPPSPNPSPPNLHNVDSEFQEKMLYLDSIGIDIFSLITNRHPGPILLSSSLETIKSTLNYLTSTLNLTSPELCRLISMCPEILSLAPSTLAPVFAFLLREACVESTSDLKRAINRRPRLLISSVPHRLRPTLYFLQSIGICEPQRHTYLLSCSVEEKLLPRIHYFQEIGFSYRDAVSMFRRFPQLFNYSLKNNIEPKLNYFVVEMGRDLKELKEFPQYFSFSLENRIKPRHSRCMEKGVCFSLPSMLRTCEAEFHARLEVLHGSSLPLKSSPLYHVNCDTNHSDSNIKG